MTGIRLKVTVPDHHDAFLKRNGNTIAAILDAYYPRIRRELLPLLDELTVLVATNQTSALQGKRASRVWHDLFLMNSPAVRASWQARDWALALRKTVGLDPAAPRRLALLYRKLSLRKDYPTIGATANWSNPMWRSLMRSIGCRPSLAGSLTALVLDRTEMPSGPLTSHVYGRIGFRARRDGRPSPQDVFPKDVEVLKWGIQQLAASKCTPRVRPGSFA